MSSEPSDPQMTGKPVQSPRTHRGAIREPRSFGKRREPATITISRAGNERRITIGPVFLSITLSLVAMFIVGYLGATAYLFFRDDLIGAARIRNARLMHDYEDRIATLRANLDRVTSRQLLDQQAIETKIDELMRRQEQLHARGGKIAPLLEEASKFGLTDKIRDREAVSAKSQQASIDPVKTGAIPTARPPQVITPAGLVLRGARDAAATHDQSPAPLTKPDINDIAATETLFSSVAKRIDNIDAGQRALLDNISQVAANRTAHIAKVLNRLDVPLPEKKDEADEPVGGPYIPPVIDGSFDSHLKNLDLSLSGLERMSERLDTVPLANPAPGHQVTSGFGNRIDPFLERLAMHPGIDFRAPMGMKVRATAAGKVIDAGRNGGYGNMVEIDHGDGIATRYAHLSRVLVEPGQEVERGAVIGLSGSTGRSTGPHLHYEVRRQGEAVDPVGFLKAGRELAGLY